MKTLSKFSKLIDGLSETVGTVSQITDKLGMKKGGSGEAHETEVAAQAPVQPVQSSAQPAQAPVQKNTEIATIENLSDYLQSINGVGCSEYLALLKSQLQILRSVKSPSMNGMMLDNLVQCLNESLQLAESEESREQLRSLYVRSVQNYVFLSEAQLKYEQQKHDDASRELLIQVGDMMSDTISGILTLATPAGTGGAVVRIKNFMEPIMQRKGLLRQAFSFFADRKILEKCENDFYETLEHLFYLLDKHQELFGKSILLNGLITNYEDNLVEHHRDICLKPIINGLSSNDFNILDKFTENISNGVGKLFKSNIYGAVSSGIAALGNIAEAIMKHKKTKDDILSYFVLIESLENDIPKLEAKLREEEQDLKDMREEKSKIGFFKFGQKKDANAKIEVQLQEVEMRREALEKAESSLQEVKRIFPTYSAVKKKLDSYEANLRRIADKYAI